MKAIINDRKYAFSSFNSHLYKPNTDIEKLRAEKREFLREFSTKYGYNGKIDYIREEEYPQLRSAIYLDHTGATTFSKSMIINFHNDLLNNLYGNPHSNSASSQASSMRIDGVRKRILKYFNANEGDYDVIFTQNATAAIKLAGEMFPWTERSTYRHLRESHNSINGLRRFLEAINPDNIKGVTEKEVIEMINNPQPYDEYKYGDEYGIDNEVTYNLFAYPAQCNYSGMRFPLNWISKIKRSNTKRSKTLVLLDAAAYVPSAQLSLADKKASADFICLSFYKMFGFPTGLGALIVKSELNPILRKGYFGGGTINSVVYDKTWQEFSTDISTRYEDGTVNYLNIIALDHAFDAFEKIYGNIKNVSNHVTSLNTYLSRNMRSLRHWNGTSVCTINSDRDFSDSKKQGGIFSFNVKRSDGSLVGYIELEKLANTHGIHIRSGGNCNPGSISRWNGIKADEVIQNYDEGKHCNDEQDIYKGKLYGAARVSIGAMTTIEDVLIWLDFFKRNYVEIMPGRSVHGLSSSKVANVGPSKSFKFTGKSRESREDTRASTYKHENPFESSTMYKNESSSSSQEDLKAPIVYKNMSSKSREDVRAMMYKSKSREELRASTLYNPKSREDPRASTLPKHYNKSREDLRASTLYNPKPRESRSTLPKHVKSREDLRAFASFGQVGPSKSHENLKASTIYTYEYENSPKHEDMRASSIFKHDYGSLPKSREDLKSPGGHRYEYGSSSKSREDLSFSKVSKVQRYNNTNGNVVRDHTIRNVKSYHHIISK